MNGRRLDGGDLVRALSEPACRGERRIVSVDPWGVGNAIRDTAASSEHDGQAVVPAADKSGSLQFGEGVAESVVVDAQGRPELCPGDGLGGGAKGSEDPIAEGHGIGTVWHWGGILGRTDDLQVRGGTVGLGHKAKLQRFDVGSSSVLESQSNAVSAGPGAREIHAVIIPCVQVPRAS
jgi:hypothetical protein